MLIAFAQDHDCCFSFLLSHQTMFFLLVFVVLCTSCLAETNDLYSFSNAVGGGSGTSFSTAGEGRITGVRLWETSSAYITGLQLRYGYAWTPVFGRQVGIPQELELFDDEAIVQISGKYSSSYIYQLFFVTSERRFLMAGNPTQISFNMYPEHQGAELKMLSGRFNSAGITSLGAHWGLVYVNENNATTT